MTALAQERLTFGLIQAAGLVYVLLIALTAWGLA